LRLRSTSAVSAAASPGAGAGSTPASAAASLLAGGRGRLGECLLLFCEACDRGLGPRQLVGAVVLHLFERVAQGPTA
jgi:hypothetical protein